MVKEHTEPTDLADRVQAYEDATDAWQETRSAVVEEVERLAGQGFSAHAIATAGGLSFQQVIRALTDHGSEFR